MAKPNQIYIRPLMVTTAGGSTQLARLKFNRGGSMWRLPPEGDWVPKFGNEGAHWTRRIADGGCEIAEPPGASKSKAKPKKVGE